MNAMKTIILCLIISISHFDSICQSTDFTYENVNNQSCLPITLQFTQTSTGSPVGYLWDFGNGSRSNNAHPTSTFTLPGTYTVRLITVYANNTAQMVKNVIINRAVSAEFLTSRNILCQPDTIHFIANQTNEVLSYTWNFGDSSDEVTTTFPDIDHYFSRYGNFTVSLKVIGVNGCNVIEQQSVRINQPEITGSVINTEGCVPITTEFNVQIHNYNNNQNLYYLWNFGDGSTSDITSNQINHTYTQSGVYIATLTIYNSEGCTNTFHFDSIRFGIPPTNLNSYPEDSIFCGSEKAKFISTSTLANQYNWNFGGEFSTTTDTLIAHKFSSLGEKQIIVTANFNGCLGMSDTFTVRVIGVIAKYQHSNTCTNKKTFLFRNTSLGNVSYCLWKFGDGNTSIEFEQASNTYLQNGRFNAHLFISDSISGCVDSVSKFIYTANPILLNPDQTICINTSSQFTLINNYSNPSIRYRWNVLGLSSINTRDTILIVRASITGIFNNEVIINNGASYCRDTIKLNHLIKVRGPNVNFSSVSELCINKPFSVVNLTLPFQNSDTIISWHWNFGITTNQENLFQPSEFFYPNEKSYQIKLLAIDKNGCMDSLVKRLYVHPMPFIWIIPKIITVCAGQSTILIGYTSDSIIWTPVNSNLCSSCDTISISPPTSMQLFAIVNNVFGCESKDSAEIKIVTPFNAKILNNDTAICSGEKVQLEVFPNNKIIQWIPDYDLNSATIYNPIATPGHEIIYYVLMGDSNRCFTSSDSIKININAAPVINAGENKSIPYQSSFSLNPIYSTNVRDFLWTPSDYLNCNTCPNPIGNLETSTTYTIKVKSDSGCIAKDDVTIFIECNGANIFMPGAFTPNNDQLNDYYKPVTRGIKMIKHFYIYNRLGQRVYEKSFFMPNEKILGWNGKFKNTEQEQAVYIYIVEATCDVGKEIIAKGSFILLR